MRNRLILPMVVAMITAAGPAAAAPRVRNFERVPIEQLIASLESQFEHDTSNGELAWRVSRLHGIAYAQKMDSVAVDTRTGRESLPPLVPRAIRAAKDDSTAQWAGEHLDAALQWYETTLRLNPASSGAQLGYGWCLEQAGRVARAKDAYQAVIDREFARYDRDDDADPPNRAITAEALLRLIDLLDPERDAKELKRRETQLEESNLWP